MRATPLFRGLSADDQRIAALASLKTYERGDSLARGRSRRAPHDHREGTVKIVTHGTRGTRSSSSSRRGSRWGDRGLQLHTLPGERDLHGGGLAPVGPAARLLRAARPQSDFARAIIRELTKLVVSMARKLQEMRGKRWTRASRSCSSRWRSGSGPRARRHRDPDPPDPPGDRRSRRHHRRIGDSGPIALGARSSSRGRTASRSPRASGCARSPRGPATARRSGRRLGRRGRGASPGGREPASSPRPPTSSTRSRTASRTA